MGCRVGKSPSAERPTIIVMSWSFVVPAIVPVPTLRPSREDGVAIGDLRTSSRKWLM
jgi:hypothetical protein